ncbi:MAG: ABC transporter permease [Candidatus Altiarchaeota archaeon]|nr:ABC transporter permease [Candidatus Altiarchaeota archaeon]
MIEWIAVYVLWLRELKRFYRSKSRIIGSLVVPLFFLVFLGFGFTKTAVAGVPEGVDYITFLVPGIVGMTMLFSSMFAGISVLWDREFGFLKEIMVAPVKRVSIVLGRIVGGMTTTMIQGTLILLLSTFLGFKITGVMPLLGALLFMVLISTTFIGLGLVSASKMTDMHGFQLIMNFVIFPLFFLSGALFPIENLPSAIKFLSYIDPLTYGVDGLRASLIGASSFPFMVDLIVCIGFSLLMVVLGTYLFDKSESV